MALSLGIGFPGVIFPITIAMRDFLKLLAKTGQSIAWLVLRIDTIAEAALH